MFILSIMLPNLFIPDVPFLALLSTLIRRQFQVKPATLLILIDILFFLWWRSFMVSGTKVAPFSYLILMWGVYFTACVIFSPVILKENQQKGCQKVGNSTFTIYTFQILG